MRILAEIVVRRLGGRVVEGQCRSRAVDSILGLASWVIEDKSGVRFAQKLVSEMEVLMF